MARPIIRNPTRGSATIDIIVVVLLCCTVFVGVSTCKNFSPEKLAEKRTLESEAKGLVAAHLQSKGFSVLGVDMFNARSARFTVRDESGKHYMGWAAVTDSKTVDVTHLEAVEPAKK